MSVLTAARTRPELRTRVRARLRRSTLDRLLAAGEPAWASRELSWRAAELSSPTARRAIADRIEALLDEVSGPPHPIGAAVPVDRDAVLGCQELLWELADDLRGVEPICPGGVVLLRRLLRDGGSPIYAPGNQRALETALIRVTAALLVD